MRSEPLVTWTCNRCNKREVLRANVYPKRWAELNLTQYQRSGEREVHLCESCHTMFQDFFLNEAYVFTRKKEADSE